MGSRCVDKYVENLQKICTSVVWVVVIMPVEWTNTTRKYEKVNWNNLANFVSWPTWLIQLGCIVIINVWYQLCTVLLVTWLVPVTSYVVYIYWHSSVFACGIICLGIHAQLIGHSYFWYVFSKNMKWLLQMVVFWVIFIKCEFFIPM